MDTIFGIKMEWYVYFLAFLCFVGATLGATTKSYNGLAIKKIAGSLSVCLLAFWYPKHGDYILLAYMAFSMYIINRLFKLKKLEQSAEPPKHG